MKNIEILTFPSGPFETNAYIIVCKQSQKAAIIDPAPDSRNVLIQAITAKKITPDKIILTHTHWDHIADCAAVADHYAIPVLVHKEDAYNLIKPGSDHLPCWLTIQGVNPAQLLKEGDVIPIGNSKWEVIHTPGHTPGGICLYCKEERVLISGDTLFKRSIGNLSFPTGDPERMWLSLDKLANLPPDVEVFPGHGDATAIGKENWLPRAKELFG
jgi:hydroxyacylglutathione hydrolase